MGSPTWDDIPDEICETIFAECVHTELSFCSQIEYGMVSMMQQPFPPEISLFAAGVVPVCKRFHRIATGILWKRVVLRTASSFRLVSALSPTYGHHTLRLELRLEEEYDLPLIQDVLSHMPNIQVFLNRNFTKHITPPLHTNPRDIIEALSHHKPSLRRIQFDAEWEYPSVLQLRDLLNANPQLEALRVCGIAPTPGTTVMESIAQNPLNGNSCLHSFSLGATYWIWQTEHRERAISSFLRLLTTSGAFPALKKAHIFENTSATTNFFERYGRQLSDLLYVPPDRNSMHSWEANSRHFSDLCPNITKVAWFIKNWNSVDSVRPLPESHCNIQAADIVYHKLEPDVLPGYEATIRRLFEHLLSGDFPSLIDLTFTARGGQIPMFQHTSWFHEIVRALQQKGETKGREGTATRGIEVHVL